MIFWKKNTNKFFDTFIKKIFKVTYTLEANGGKLPFKEFERFKDMDFIKEDRTEVNI